MAKTDLGNHQRVAQTMRQASTARPSRAPRRFQRILIQIRTRPAPGRHQAENNSVAMERSSVNASTVLSTPSINPIGRCFAGGVKKVSKFTPHKARKTPPTPPAHRKHDAFRQHLSHQTRAARAHRRANGDFLSRTVARASSRFATFTQAISNTSPAMAIKNPSTLRKKSCTP